MQVKTSEKTKVEKDLKHEVNLLDQGNIIDDQENVFKVLISTFVMFVVNLEGLIPLGINNGKDDDMVN